MQKNKDFSQLKHEVQRWLVFLLVGYGARTVFSAVNLAGASLKCCRCSKAVSHLN